MASGRRIVVILVALLLAAVVVAAAVLFLLPTGEPTPTQTPPTTMPGRLNTSVLQRSDYTGLDTSLLQQGALPVQPPPNTGKANPFL